MLNNMSSPLSIAGTVTFQSQTLSMQTEEEKNRVKQHKKKSTNEYDGRQGYSTEEKAFREGNVGMKVTGKNRAALTHETNGGVFTSARS